MENESENVSPNSIAGEHLRSFVQRLENLEEEIRGLNEDKKEVYAEAKGTGFDTKVIRKVIARRRKDKSDLQEEEYLLDLYEQALRTTEKNAATKTNPEDNDDFLD